MTILETAGVAAEGIAVTSVLKSPQQQALAIVNLGIAWIGVMQSP